MRRLLPVIAVFALFTSALPAQAQRVVRRAAPSNVDSSHVAKFQLADTFFRAGQFDRAITLFEDLYQSDPDTYAFFDRLKEAYENVKRYDDAIALVEDRLKRLGRDDAGLMAERARLVYLKGDEQQAFDLWREALPSKPDQTAYRQVFNSMLDVRLFDRAIDVLEKGRRALGDINLFQADLAYLYSLTGRHEEAMNEYLGLLAANDRQLNYVRSRLNRFLEQEGALEASIEVAERGVRKAPLNRGYRELLGWLYMEAGDYNKALDAYRAIDRLEKEDGRMLLGFAQRAADAGAYDAAMKAFDEVLGRYPDAPVAPEVQFGLAETHERWAEKTHERLFDAQGNRLPAPHYEAALEQYRTFLQNYPNHPYYPEALRRIGRLQQDVFFDLGEADATLTQVAERYPKSDASYQARFDLGRIALVRGDLEDARLAFSRLVDEMRTGELAEEARYQEALIHFYRGEFDAALTLTAALDANTSTDVANDAIELKVLLLENKGPDSLSTPLRTYARAALLQRRRHTTEAVDTLEQLLQDYGQHPIADDARFLRAQALRGAGKVEEAYAAFAELPLMHPDSFLADRSLFNAAEIQELDLGEPDAALKTYTKLLTDYPGSLLIPDVRQRIRALRSEGA